MDLLYMYRNLVLSDWTSKIQGVQVFLGQVSVNGVFMERSPQSNAQLIDLANIMNEELRQEIQQFLQNTIQSLRVGVMSVESLDQIQKEFIAHLDKIETFLGYLRIDGNLFVNTIGMVERLYLEMMTNSLLVDVHPPAIIKQTKGETQKIQGAVRFLAGSKCSSPDGQHLPIVEFVIIGEDQDASTDKVPVVTEGTNIDSIDVKSGVVSFKNIKLKTMKQGKNSLREVFCFKYSTQLLVNNESHEVWCYSRPFTLNTHINQTTDLEQLMFWQYNFSEPYSPLKIVSTVRRSQLRDALAKFFMSQTKCTRPLTDDNLMCLGRKLFGSNNNEFFSHEKFFAKPSPNTLGFWEFFYGVIKLLKTDQVVQQIWNSGYIIGFIKGSEAEQLLLRERQPNSFLVRFSETDPSAITISFMIEQQLKHCKYSSNELDLHNLAEKIMNNLQYSKVLYYSMKDGKYTTLEKEKAIQFKEEEPTPPPINSSVKGHYVKEKGIFTPLDSSQGESKSASASAVSPGNSQNEPKLSQPQAASPSFFCPVQGMPQELEHQIVPPSNYNYLGQQETQLTVSPGNYQNVLSPESQIPSPSYSYPVQQEAPLVMTSGNFSNGFQGLLGSQFAPTNNYSGSAPAISPGFQSSSNYQTRLLAPSDPQIPSSSYAYQGNFQNGHPSSQNVHKYTATSPETPISFLTDGLLADVMDYM